MCAAACCSGSSVRLHPSPSSSSSSAAAAAAAAAAAEQAVNTLGRGVSFVIRQLFGCVRTESDSAVLQGAALRACDGAKHKKSGLMSKRVWFCDMRPRQKKQEEGRESSGAGPHSSAFRVWLVQRIRIPPPLWALNRWRVADANVIISDSLCVVACVCARVCGWGSSPTKCMASIGLCVPHPPPPEWENCCSDGRGGAA